MKKLLLGLLILAGSAKAAESPCYFGGTYVKCFPAGGIYLDNSKALLLGTDNTTNYVELIAPTGMASNWTMTLPSAAGGIGQVLYDSSGSGDLAWQAAGVTPSQLNSALQLVSSKPASDLVCHANVALTGMQTCDGQATSGASRVLLMAQTDPTENGEWNNDDFGAWVRVTNVSNLANVPGSLITVTEQGGGTSYQDTLWFGVGDGSSTANFRLIPTTASNVQLTASRATVTDSNSHLAAATTTATEIGYVNGVTSAIQTQLNTKTTNPGTTTGDVFYCSNTSTPCTVARLAIGSSTTVLHGGTTPSYSAVSVANDVTGVLSAANGGTGVANNASATLTRTGNFDLNLTTSGATGVTLPTTGTLATLAGAESLSNKTLDSGTTVFSTGVARHLVFSIGGASSKTTTFTTSSSQDREITFPNATTTLVGTNTSDSLTNKTIPIADVNFTIQDDGDATKQAQFEASGITTGTTRTFTLPNATGALALNPGTTTGDITYCSNTATPCTRARLAIGTSSQVLLGGTAPSYGAVPAAALPEVTQSAKGAVLSAGQLLGTNTNDAASAGYVGEILPQASTTTSTTCGASTVATDITNQVTPTLNGGSYLIETQVTFSATAMTANNELRVNISCTANASAGQTGLEGISIQPSTATSIVASDLTVSTSRRITIATGNTATCKTTFSLDYASATNCQAKTTSYIRAVRTR